MAPRLTPDDVRHIAQLAHLELSDAEVELFTGQLADILAYADAVQLVDTTGVVPTAHALVTETPWRGDEPVTPPGRDAMLANAPDAARDAGLFRVPKVR
jgi:aspartyl-tRNA(Asn)/glutamyl-tRNA(Gln) amidotransferase subunit C